MAGLLDFLVLPDLDANPPYSVINDREYDKYKTPDSIPMIYSIKSQRKNQRASDIHDIFFRWVGNKQVKFLHSESEARGGYKGSKEGESEYLRPFTMTDFLQDEIMNLEYKQSGNNTDITQVSQAIQKDRFSALEYGLFWIYLEEKDNRVKSRTSSNDAMNFFMGRGANISGKPKRLW